MFIMAGYVILFWVIPGFSASRRPSGAPGHPLFFYMSSSIYTWCIRQRGHAYTFMSSLAAAVPSILRHRFSYILLFKTMFLRFVASSRDTHTFSGPCWRLPPMISVFCLPADMPHGFYLYSFLPFRCDLPWYTTVSSGDMPTFSGPRWRPVLHSFPGGPSRPRVCPLYSTLQQRGHAYTYRSSLADGSFSLQSSKFFHFS